MPYDSSIPSKELFRRIFRRTRMLDKHEWGADPATGPGVLGFRFHAPRTPTRFEIISNLPLEIEELVYEIDGDVTPVAFTTRHSASTQDDYVAGAEPNEPREIRRAWVHVAGDLERLECRAQIYAIYSADPAQSDDITLMVLRAVPGEAVPGVDPDLK